MLDPDDFTLYALADWPPRLPKRRGGRKIHLSTLHRWGTEGCRGVVLETTSVGGTKCVSAAQLCAFFAALSNRPSPGQKPRTCRQRERDIDRAERECEDRGA
jgi:hypothetical protein